MEYLQAIGGIKLNHVPYKGAAPAFIDLIAGQCSIMFANITGSMTHIGSGRVRVIAVSSAKRAAVLPQVPGSVLDPAAVNTLATSWGGNG